MSSHRKTSGFTYIDGNGDEVCRWCGARNEDCDCLDRSSCLHAGEPGHQQCGWCFNHKCPRFACGCDELKEVRGRTYFQKYLEQTALDVEAAWAKFEEEFGYLKTLLENPSPTWGEDGEAAANYIGEMSGCVESIADKLPWLMKCAKSIAGRREEEARNERT